MITQHLSKLRELHDQARAAGLAVRFSHPAVLVIAAPDDAAPPEAQPDLSIAPDPAEGQGSAALPL